MGFPICRMQVCAVAGQIAFISFHLHGEVGEQRDSYVAFVVRDAEVEIGAWDIYIYVSLLCQFARIIKEIR